MKSFGIGTVIVQIIGMVVLVPIIMDIVRLLVEKVLLQKNLH